MQRYDAIEKRIESQDIEGLRRAVASICYTSRDFSSGEFEEVIDYIESRGITLKEQSLVGELVAKGKSTFIDEDFGKAVFELGENFCEERIQDVMKIGKTLYKKEGEEKTEKPEHRKNSKTDRGQFPKEVSRQGIHLGILAAIVVVVILILIKILK